MKIEPIEEMRGSTMKRQRYMLSNLGLFYIILIALFGIPLLGTFVVVLIKGVLDFRYVILASGIILSGLLVFYAGRFGWRLFRRMKKDGRGAFADAAAQAGRGQPVELTLFNGLVTFSCGGRRPPAALPGTAEPVAMLPDPYTEASPQSSSPPPAMDGIARLQALVRLKEDGVIDHEEFMALKQKLIRDICDAPDRSADSGSPSVARPSRTPEACCIRAVSRD